LSTSTQRYIELGLVCPPLRQQLQGLVPADVAEGLHELNQALNLIILRGLIPDAQCMPARKRLMRIIHTTIKSEQTARRAKAKAGGAR
jgi:hypothetical protein